jgi:hypothetical protein
MHWTYNLHTAQWEAAFGGWRAVVESLSTRGVWHAAIKRRYPPHTYCDQADFGWPRTAMAWCEAEIMRQRWSG